MPFNSQREVELRLAGNDEPLTVDEIRDLRPWIRHLLQGNTGRIYLELGLLNLEAIYLNIEAISSFDTSSARLSRVMIWLTIGIFLLTAVLAYDTLARVN